MRFQRCSSQTTKLLHQPAHTKHGRRRRDRGSVVSSSLEVLGSLWRDRKEEQGEEGRGGEEEEEEPPCASTLKGTCVTSSNGDNYIILSPVAPQEQVSLRGGATLLSYARLVCLVVLQYVVEC